MDWRLSIRLEFFNKFFSVDQLVEYKPHENFVSICPCGKKKEKRKKDEEVKPRIFDGVTVKIEKYKEEL